MERIGFIGIGVMGRPMSANLVRAGHPVTVYDVAAGATAPLVELGARAAGSIAELTEASDVVFTMVPNSPDVEAVVLGPGGIAENGREGVMVVDTSTIYPEVTDRVAAGLADRGMEFVDAGVGRQQAHAETGELMFMVGATDEGMARVRPLLEIMGDTIVHVGPPGQGIRMKLINNLLAGFTNQASADVVAFALKLGLPFDRVMEVLTGTAARTGHLSITWPNKILKGDDTPGFSIALQDKDMNLALQLAESIDAPLDFGEAVRKSFASMIERGYGGKDFSAAFAAACEKAGVPLPPPGADMPGRKQPS